MTTTSDAENGDELGLHAGLSQEQASALAELFGGQHSLLGRPRRACIADLIAFLAHRSEDARLWPQLCTVRTANRI